MKKILLPVDDQQLEPKVFETTCDLVQKFDAELIIFHVQPDYDLVVNQYAPYLVESHTNLGLDDSLFEQVSEGIVTSVRTQFENVGIFNISPVIVEGNPASEIVDYAEREKCDLIVLSTHGMGAVRRFLLGSVTSRVVHHATVPVLVIR